MGGAFLSGFAGELLAGLEGVGFCFAGAGLVGVLLAGVLLAGLLFAGEGFVIG